MSDPHILPADLFPAVTTALPLSLGELCACNEAIGKIVDERNRVIFAVDEMGDMKDTG